LLYISSNNDRHPLSKTFTPLHLSTLRFFPFKTSPNFASIHFTTLFDASLFLRIDLMMWSLCPPACVFYRRSTVLTHSGLLPCTYDYFVSTYEFRRCPDDDAGWRRDACVRTEVLSAGQWTRMTHNSHTIGMEKNTQTVKCQWAFSTMPPVSQTFTDMFAMLHEVLRLCVII